MGYGLWMATCTTEGCEQQGPMARDENDGDALDWCVQHNADNRDHVAMIVAGSEL